MSSGSTQKKNNESQQATIVERSTSTGIVVDRPLDLGRIIKDGMSMKDISTAVTALSTGEKYDLLFRHTPPPNTLPAMLSYGCNRQFNKTWLSKYP